VYSNWGLLNLKGFEMTEDPLVPVGASDLTGNKDSKSIMLGPDEQTGSQSVDIEDSPALLAVDVPPEEPLEITQRDLILDFMRSEQQELVIPEVDVHIISPVDYQGRAIYDPEAEELAQYRYESNEIAVGSREVGEPFLRAMLRHERSHFQFWNLDPDTQREVARLFMEHNTMELAEYYTVLREWNYDERYFTWRAGRIREIASNLGRGYWTEAPLYVSEQSGIYESDMMGVIDELLAFHATIGSGERKLVGYDVLPTLQKAEVIMDRLHPDLRGLLERLGFFDIREQEMYDAILRERESQRTIHIEPDEL
jgi:hypothetical protein